MHSILGTISVIIISSQIEKNILISLFTVILIIAVLFSILTKYFKLKFILEPLKRFDKHEDINKFPGKGAIFYLSGIICSLLLFERNIASAAILILALGDPAAHFIGKYYGRTRLVTSNRKLLEGTVAGTFIGTLAATVFMPFPIAFFGSAMGMFAEAMETESLNLDDNLLIPLVSGITMTILLNLL